MTKRKTSELTGAALDWAVAKVIYPSDSFKIRWSGDDGDGNCVPSIYCTSWDKYPVEYSPSTDWSQGGPLIEAHRISVEWYGDFSEWCADTMITSSVNQFGSTPLIAACRAIVVAKLGDEVDVPEDLV